MNSDDYLNEIPLRLDDRAEDVCHHYPLTPERVVHESLRPDWTHNNVGLFLYWMRTGQAPPAGWVDPDDETNIVAACESYSNSNGALAARKEFK